MDDITLTETESTAVKAYAWDSRTRVLTIDAKGGKRYRYADVPGDVVREFQDADSKGVAWGQLIRGKFQLITDEVQS